MEEPKQEYFKKSLSDFTFDMASGGAIRHLADRGYTVEQIGNLEKKLTGKGFFRCHKGLNPRRYRQGFQKLIITDRYRHHDLALLFFKIKYSKCALMISIYDGTLSEDPMTIYCIHRRKNDKISDFVINGQNHVITVSFPVSS